MARSTNGGLALLMQCEVRIDQLAGSFDWSHVRYKDATPWKFKSCISTQALMTLVERSSLHLTCTIVGRFEVIEGNSTTDLNLCGSNI